MRVRHAQQDYSGFWQSQSKWDVLKATKPS